MVKKFRPFWSFDIVNTEGWLLSMGRRGYIFRGANLKLSLFYFEKGENQKRSFRIIKNDFKGASIGDTLRNQGYESFVDGKYEIVSYDEEKVEPTLKPSRNNIIKKLIVSKDIGMVVIFFLCMQLLVFGTMRGGIMNTMCMSNIVINSLLICFVIKINYNIKLLKEEIGANYCGERLTKFEEREVEDTGKTIKFLKLFWVYRTISIENWLEEMEDKGYNLYKVTGPIFYFVKGKSRSIKYFIDYGKIKDTEYETMNKDNGWQIYYGNDTAFGRTIWGKETTDKNEEVFMDKSQLKKSMILQILIFAIGLIIWINIFLGSLKLGMNRSGFMAIMWFFICFIGMKNIYKLKKKYI